MEQTNNDAVKKEIDYHISVKSDFWSASIVTVGSTIGVIMLPNSMAKWILFTIGIIFSLIFINGYFTWYEQIKFLVNKLKNEGN